MFDIDFYDGKSVFSQLNVCIFANLRYKNEFRMMICWNDIAMNFIYYLSIAVHLFHLSIFIYIWSIYVAFPNTSLLMSLCL